jgi:hypothetical protein
MPTYQTAPLRPNVFADQASKLNPFGVLPLKGNVLKHLPLNPSEHPSWKKEADLRALAKVANTKMSEMAMLQGPQPFKAQTPYTTYRGSKGDAFSHTFSGGRVWTREAEGMVSHLLKDRIGQLDALTQSTFEQVAPERLQTNIPETDTFPLDQIFSNLVSSLSQGLINPTLLGFSNSIMSFLLTKADKIPDNKFNDYTTILAKIATLINSSFYTARNEGDYTASEVKKMTSVLNKLEKDVKAIIKFFEEYADFLGSPTKTKSAKLAAMRGKLFGLAQQNAQVSIEAAEVLQRDYEEGVAMGPGGPSDGSDSGPPSGYQPVFGDAASSSSGYSMPSGNTGLPMFEQVRNFGNVPMLSPGSVSSGYGRPMRRR